MIRLNICLNQKKERKTPNQSSHFKTPVLQNFRLNNRRIKPKVPVNIVWIGPPVTISNSLNLFFLTKEETNLFKPSRIRAFFMVSVSADISLLRFISSSLYGFKCLGL